MKVSYTHGSFHNATGVRPCSRKGFLKDEEKNYLKLTKTLDSDLG